MADEISPPLVLVMGNVVLPQTLTNPARHEERLAAEALFRLKMHKRTQAIETIMGIVRRLVEAATFTLSAEDFVDLEHAIAQYDETTTTAPPPPQTPVVPVASPDAPPR